MGGEKRRRKLRVGSFLLRHQSLSRGFGRGIGVEKEKKQETSSTHLFSPSSHRPRPKLFFFFLSSLPTGRALHQDHRAQHRRRQVPHQRQADRQGTIFLVLWKEIREKDKEMVLFFLFNVLGLRQTHFLLLPLSLRSSSPCRPRGGNPHRCSSSLAASSPSPGRKSRSSTRPPRRGRPRSLSSRLCPAQQRRARREKEEKRKEERRRCAAAGAARASLPLPPAVTSTSTRGTSRTRARTREEGLCQSTPRPPPCA